LLRDLESKLGSQLKRGVCEATEHRATGIPGIDQLLGGGVPLGSLCEISGPASSGRTSLALALLAKTTRTGELVGLVDAADSFDPISAVQAGVDLDRVLWVRARTLQETLRSCERLLQTEGFPLVVLQAAERTNASFSQATERANASLSQATEGTNAYSRGTATPRTDAGGGTRRRAAGGSGVPTSAWLRLTRLASATRTALLLISNQRIAGSHADIALSMEPVKARFTGTPALLEELETRAVLVRHRTAPTDRAASVLLSSSPSSTSPTVPAAAHDPDPDLPLTATPTPHESAA
jgi:hypothetical protein